jgi:hypothetical protein
MSYLRKVEWEIVPYNKPEVRRNCPKCGEKTHYVNTEKFRVNANKNHIDIWLIYQCNKCKSTWNLTIYERINPEYICHDKYQRFLDNDKELALSYGFDISIHNKNKSELILDSVDYHITSKELLEFSKEENEFEVKLICKYPIQLRVDKLLSEQFNISRSQIKSLCQKGTIYNVESKNLSKAKAYDGMIIHRKF